MTCREPLKLAPTDPNIRYAVRLRGEILNAIERGSFNYADHFPESKNARRFGFVASGETVGKGLAEWFAGAPLAASTRLTYGRVIDGYLLPWFQNVRLRDLTTPLIREKILALPVTLKTARNILTPLGAFLTVAAEDGKLKVNPMDHLGLERRWPLERRSSDFEADPFTWAEMAAIFAACDPDEADYWRFAFGTGLRPSEQIELLWPRVDLIQQRVRVQVARVTARAARGPLRNGTAQKAPKTQAGVRDVELTNGAWEALQRQQARTRLAGGHVWLDVRYGAPWRNEEALRKRWGTILKRAGVRYRNPYQTRHTFGSALLAAGCQPLFVAEQMGHEGTEMLDRHYGRFVRQGIDPAARAALVAFFSHFSPKVLAEARIVGASR